LSESATVKRMHSMVVGTYPERRRLDDTERSVCATLLDLQVSARNIRSVLTDASGKPLTLRDVHNQRVVNAKNSAQGLSDAQLLINAVADMLQNDEGSTAVYAVNDDSELRLLFWQTSEMRHIYEQFPEVLFVDGTYCVNSVRMPLYCMCVQDNFGNGRVCGYGLVADETFQSVYTLLELFRDKNVTSTSELCTVMVDKDFTEIACISEIFPNAKIQICTFHVLKAFRTAIGNLQGVARETKDTLRDVVQKLVYSKSTEHFYEVYAQLKDVGCTEFQTYFDRNWLGSREQWVRGLCAKNVNLLNWTNNRIESHNKQIKTAVSNSTKLHKLFLALQSLGTSKALECTYEQAIAVSKVRYQHGSAVSADLFHAVNAVCTPYAADLVLKQITAVIKSGNTATVTVSDGEAFVSCDHCDVCAVDTNRMICNCVFNMTTKLPCKHVFLFRTHSGLDMFSPELVPQRWYKSTGPSSTAIPSQCDTVVMSTSSQRDAVLSKVDKYRLVANVTKKLSDVMCSVGHNEFLAKYGMLEELVQHWSANTTVFLAVAADTEVPNVHMTSDTLPESNDSTVQSVISAEFSPIVPEQCPLPVTANISNEQTVSEQVLSTEAHPDTANTPPYVRHVPSPMLLPSTDGTSDMLIELPSQSGNAMTSDHNSDNATDPTVASTLAFAAPASIVILNDLKLPLRNSVRGRPKGAATTVVGKRKRKHTNKLDTGTGDNTNETQECVVTGDAIDRCVECGLAEPPRTHRKRTKGPIKWIECEKCQFWYHLDCVKNPPAKNPPQLEGEWICTRC